MKSKKEISDLIRDNQHKLEERPSPRAWNKLEEKLDQHEGKEKGAPRILLFRRLAMAAAVVTMVAVISIINSQSSSNGMAKAEANISPQDQFAEGLEPVYSEENKNLRQVIEFQRKLKDRYANPIQEGTQTKKLLASNKRNTSQVTSRNFNKSIAKVEKPNAVIPAVEEEVASIVMESVSKENEMEVFKDAATITLNDDVPNNINMGTPPPVVAPSAPVATSPNAPLAKAKKKDRIISKKENMLQEKLKVTGIQSLNWLSGNWASKNKRIDVLFLNNSDLVSSDFKIKEIGNELFFIANDMTYEFVKRTGTQTVFEQKNKDQIILERMGNEQFSITLVKFNSGEKVVETFKKQ